jgi:multidrug efflux pump subunit AcrB
VIYVAQPYGGMSPEQMDGFITYYYEYHFLYINGIESVESKSIQHSSLLKLTFHPGTDMAEALAQTIGYVNRARLHATRHRRPVHHALRRRDGADWLPRVQERQAQPR